MLVDTKNSWINARQEMKGKTMPDYKDPICHAKDLLKAVLAMQSGLDDLDKDQLAAFNSNDRDLAHG